MKRFSITLLSTFFVSSLASAQSLSQNIKEEKSQCRMAVPAEWKQQEILGKKISAAQSPDNAVDAVVSYMEGLPFKDFKGTVYMVYAKEKDRPKIQDDDKRLWFDIVSMAPQGKTAWYVAVPTKGGTCNAQVNFKKGDKKAEALARRIVESIQG